MIRESPETATQRLGIRASGGRKYTQTANGLRVFRVTERPGMLDCRWHHTAVSERELDGKGKTGDRLRPLDSL